MNGTSTASVTVADCAFDIQHCSQQACHTDSTVLLQFPRNLSSRDEWNVERQVRTYSYNGSMGTTPCTNCYLIHIRSRALSCHIVRDW